jgi:hypothetical protein
MSRVPLVPKKALHTANACSASWPPVGSRIATSWMCLNACCRTQLSGSAAPSLLPAEAELATA